MKAHYTLIGVVALLCSCTHKYQEISVNSTPEGASCTLRNPYGQWKVRKTPDIVKVKQSLGKLTVKCQKDGLKGTETIKPILNPPTMQTNDIVNRVGTGAVIGTVATSYVPLLMILYPALPISIFALGLPLIGGAVGGAVGGLVGLATVYMPKLNEVYYPNIVEVNLDK